MASVSIADLTISIKDNSKQAADKVLNLASALEELKNQKNGSGSALKTVANDIATLRSADMGGLVRLRKQLASAASYAEKLADAMDRVVKSSSVKLSQSATQAMSQSKGVAESAQMTTTTGTDLTDSVSGAKNASSRIEEAGKRASVAIGKIKTAIGEVGQFGSRVFHTILPSGIARTLSQLGRLMKMRILRTIVKSILAGITEGLQNVYQWSKIMGDGFAATMDGMASSVLYLKNSIGAAFAQILSLVAPHINSLIDLIVEGINYINMFFAVLAGQSTYTRAKKVAVEYGKAVEGAAGGAAGAVKDLKEQLSVLDFDELHQLQEQATPSGGGGGGGGAGGSATDYADMFEKANITDNALTRAAGWLKENFDEVLGIVEAIGLGILAWKVSTAFAGTLGSLLNLKDTFALGITLMVTGAVVEYTGAKSIGKNGINWTNIIETVLGAGMTIAGGYLAFGPAGLVLAIPLAIAVGIFGYVDGVKARFKEDLLKNPEYIRAMEELDESVKFHQAYMDIAVTVREIEYNYRKDLGKADQAQNIIDKIKAFDGLEITPEVNLEALQNLVDQFNALGFDGIIASWDIVNGKIETNVEDLQAAIDKFKEYARITALEDLYVQLDVATAEQTVAQGERDYAQWEYDEALAKIRELYPEFLMNMNDEFGNGAGWQPGEDPYDVIDVKDANKEVLELLAIAETWYEKIGELDAVIEDKDGVVSHIQALIDEILDLGSASQNTAQKLNPKSVMPYAPTSYEKITGEIISPVIGSSRSDLQKQYEQITGGSSGGLNIFADPSKNAKPYVAVLDDVTYATEQASVATKDYGDVIRNYQATAGGSGVATLERLSLTLGDTTTAEKNTTTGANKLNYAFKNIGTGVDLVPVQNKFKQDLPPSFFSGIGTGAKSAIEKELNGIGNGMNYSTIMGTIDSGLSKAQKSIAFSNIGKAMGGDIQNGTTSGYNSGTVMTSYLNGLTAKQKVTLFSAIGSAMGSDMQSGAYKGFSSAYIINAYLSGLTDKQKNALFSAVGTAMGDDMEGGAWNSFSTWYIISEYLKGLTNAVGNMSFSSIGTTIAGDIKWGIQNSLNGQTINVQTSVGGINSTTKGKMWVNMTAAEGALGLNAGTVFIAGEAGAEAVGTIGGKTGVANRDQIASAIAMALRPMLAGGGGMTTTNVNVQMDSRTVARASLKGQRAMNRQYNIVANA